nr:ribonuclease H-like domain-containing protein [Tanacetum cinerariifolium]
MATMGENVIAAGAEIRPSMLKKGMYDSWQSRIMLYIEGKENGEMLIDSIKNDAKQAKDLHNVKFDQLYTFLKHNEKDANEVQVMRQRYLDPVALIASTYNPNPSYSSQRSQLKKAQEKDKIGSKRDKNGKRGEAGRSGGALLLMLMNKGWDDGNGLNPDGGFKKPRGGLETRGGRDGLEGPGGQLSKVVKEFSHLVVLYLRM